LPRIEEDGGNWLRRPKLYKRVVEPHNKKKNRDPSCSMQTEITNLIVAFWQQGDHA